MRSFDASSKKKAMTNSYVRCPSRRELRETQRLWESKLGTGSCAFLQKGIECSVLQSFRSLEEDPMYLGQVGVEVDTRPYSEALCQGITEAVSESHMGLSPIVLQVCLLY